MATLRMTEKEAIQRGIISQADALEQRNKPKEPEIRYIRIPVPVVRYRKGVTIFHLLWFVFGWLLGFMMALRFV